jgi:hypothetical protein
MGTNKGKCRLLFAFSHLSRTTQTPFEFSAWVLTSVKLHPPNPIPPRATLRPLVPPFRDFAESVRLDAVNDGSVGRFPWM